jgi:hypothetical protein
MYPITINRHTILKIIFSLLILGLNHFIIGQHIIPKINIDSSSLTIQSVREPIIEKYVTTPLEMDPFNTRCSPVEMIPDGFKLSLDQHQVEQPNVAAFVGAGALGFLGFSIGIWGKQPQSYLILETIEVEVDNPRLNGVILGISGAILGAIMGSSIQRFNIERKKDPNKKIIEIQEGQGCLF